ncbi:hypothetical protein [Gryllotalpicola protaetiae]|uniref:Uncharacterized protein n=1 Tax=Gryllotalpicola protaetiae TaxID=2419771 RepID=A0A387BJQ4_9MICO|nr:hypothetical protein [Gryllotalpicola protaetiae]AYG02384.1 hypothetical protein D7I44_01765 [Gryllotalpicola protaetiae]
MLSAETIAHLIELPGVYDGWSVAVLKDGTYVNRWAYEDDPARPLEGYERRYRATQECIENWGQE